MSDLAPLHDATTALREAVIAWLGDLVPPYADEVLLDLQELTAEPEPDLARVRALLAEAYGAMEMLPEVPPQWDAVERAAGAVGLAPV